MPIRNKQVKNETRVGEVSQDAVRTQLNDLGVAARNTPEVLLQPPASVIVSPEEAHTPVSGQGLQHQNRTVPVILDGKPLMPTTASRARRWIKEKKATPFWAKGVFCVRLNVGPSAKNLQDIACGIDPGSKKEGFTVKSEAHTYLNVQADAVTWVKRHVKQRRMMRRTRRQRNTPCRACRRNRASLRAEGRIPPSTRARWQWKLRIVRWLSKLYPISMFVVEDIKAKTKGQRRWDASFSPLEIGKNWFYAELGNIAEVSTKQGYETKELRDALGLKKSKNKLKSVFEAHCVDSWVLANWWTGGDGIVDNKDLLLLTPLRFHRRQLHMLQPVREGIRKLYGGTRSLGFKRGSLVIHPKRGLTYVGGTSKGRVSLHDLSSGKNISRKAKPEDIKFLAYNTWRTALSLPAKAGSLSAG